LLNALPERGRVGRFRGGAEDGVGHFRMRAPFLPQRVRIPNAGGEIACTEDSAADGNRGRQLRNERALVHVSIDKRISFAARKVTD
jgi:hypothetical protein